MAWSIRLKNYYYAFALTDFFVFLSCAEQGFNELPQVQDVLFDAVGSPHHHYLLDLVGFSKEYREPVIEHIDESLFEVELVNPSELPDWFTGKKPDKSQNKPIDDDYDDMPF